MQKDQNNDPDRFPVPLLSADQEAVSRDPSHISILCLSSSLAAAVSEFPVNLAISGFSSSPGCAVFPSHKLYTRVHCPGILTYCHGRQTNHGNFGDRRQGAQQEKKEKQIENIDHRHLFRS